MKTPPYSVCGFFAAVTSCGRSDRACCPRWISPFSPFLCRTGCGRTGRLFFLVLPLLIILSGTCLPAVDHSGYSSVRDCLGCHPMASPTHTMKGTPRSGARLPLDASGRIVCITCHDCAAGTCKLRDPAPELCHACHDCARGMACILGTAHIGDSQDILRLSLDNCLACHDGSVAKDIGTHGHPTNALYLTSRRGLNPKDAVERM